MRKIFLYFCLVGLVAGSVPAFSQSLISDKASLENMHKMYLARKAALGERIPELFAMSDTINPPALTEATKFLIAYAPLSDLANLKPIYFRQMAELALQTKVAFTWGPSIPNEVFLHFVLPYRVNNENPDSARGVFFSELQGRVKGMSMYDAALEVNHWCHEKVVYRSTDERTSSPLATIKTAYGRCGEESTFTVAAMRSVGIPARQVYTPRWAHTDDNHAWVEVWIDGKWFFMGACEPDPELNMGWFSGPATRAMMMHTNTFGPYSGPEKMLMQKPLFSKLNLLSNYAPTRAIGIQIVNDSGMPLKGVKVGFTLYNYGEFYEIATVTTAENGIALIETGYGDLLLWMTDSSRFAWWKLPAMMTDTVTLVFEDQQANVNEYASQMVPDYIDMNFTPPFIGNVVKPGTDKEALNQQRLKEEDAIRADYEATFPDTIFLRERYGNNRFGEAIINYILKSRGNYFEIEAFYDRSGDQESAIDLLSVISEKDLRDTPARVLLDHLRSSEEFSCRNCPDDIITKYILNPRIGRELLSPWRSVIQNAFSKKEIKAFRKNPEILVKWVRDNIKIDRENNYYGVTLFPESVLKLRVADAYSRDVFFVASCRSFGIPARLEPATYAPEYMVQQKWIAAFPKEILPESAKGQLVLTNPNSFVPKYSTHFTIAKLIEGQFHTLDYELDETLNNFPCTLNLDAGTYRLMTGSRQDDGSILTRWSFCKVAEGKIIEQPITFNEHELKPNALFELSTEILVSSLDGEDSVKIKELITPKGAVVALIDPLSEPGKHFLAELQPVTGDFEKWGGNILLVLPSERATADFSAAAWIDLPANSKWLYDGQSGLQNEIKAKTGKESMLPEVMFVAQSGEVFYLSRGYQVNTAQMILKIIRLLE